MTNKEKYFLLCERYNDMPIFMQAWWMSGVCAGKQWDVLLSYDTTGEIRAALPYLTGKRLGMRYIIMPQQTQIGGVWLRPDIRGSHADEQAVCTDFCTQLQDLHLAYYYQQFPIGSPLPALMKQNGFTVKERITYRINDLTDLDSVIARFSKNKKRQLQKALSLHADSTLGAEDFYKFHTHCLAERKKQISYTREFFLVMYKKATERNQGQIVCIRDADNELLAAAFLVWDAQSMYYLIPCYTQSRKDSGAGALLVLEALKIAREKGKQFDFEGSMIRSVANHYRQFGSQPTPYCSVRRYWNPLFALLLLANRIRNRKKQ